MVEVIEEQIIVASQNLIFCIFGFGCSNANYYTFLERERPDEFVLGLKTEIYLFFSILVCFGFDLILIRELLGLVVSRPRVCFLLYI